MTNRPAANAPQKLSLRNPSMPKPSMQHHPHDDLKAFLDHELPLSRRLVVRIHLARCAACRQETIAMTQITEDVRADETKDEAKNDAATTDATSRTDALAPDLRARILTGIDEIKPADQEATGAKAPEKQARNAAQVLMPRPRVPVFAWGAIAALVLMFGAASTSLMKSQNESPAVQSVFNTANNALSTSTGDALSDDASSTSASSPAAAPGASPIAGASADSAGAPSAGPVQQSRETGSAATALRRSDNFARTMRTRNRDSASDQRFSKLARKSGDETSAQSGYGSQIYSNRGKRSIAEDALAPARSVYKEASITVEVSDLEKQTGEVERMVKNANGFIADNDLETAQNGLRRAQMLIKVPAAQFETILKTIGALGIVKNKKISGEDITARLSDARQAKTVLANQLQAQVERLKKSAKKDKVQERYQARMIQIQVAQARARFNILNRLATLSTMTVQLREKTAPQLAPQGGGFSEELGKTRNQAMSSFLIAARWPIMLLMWILAYSPLWIPLLLAWRIATCYRPRRVP